MKIFNVTWTHTIHFQNGQVETYNEENWGYALEFFTRNDGVEQIRITKDGYFDWVQLTDRSGQSIIENLEITVGNE